MRIYLKRVRAKFHSNPIWVDGASGFFEECCPNKNKNKMSSGAGDMKSVCDLEIESATTKCRHLLSAVHLDRRQGSHSYWQKNPGPHE